MSMKTKHIVPGVLMLFGILSACETSENSRPGLDPITVSHALNQMDSCGAYEKYVKKSAIQRMQAMVEQRCQGMLEEVERREEHNYGVSKNSSDDVMAGSDGMAAPEAAEVSDDDGGGEYSVTNTQEAGVDEADLVKTDGDYLYVVSGGDLVIVSLSDSGILAETGRIALTGTPTELFLYKDVVVAFSRLSSSDVPEEMLLPTLPNDKTFHGKDIEEPMVDIMMDPYYGYGAGPFTEISVVDISDKSAPALLRSDQYAGQYVSSRRIDGMVRGVLSSPAYALDVPTWIHVDYWDKPKAKAISEINHACDELIATNTDYINGLSLEDLLPKKLDSKSDDVVPIAECTNIFGASTPAGNGLLTVVSLDLDNPTQNHDEVAVVGQEGHVYASTSALYLTTASEYVSMAFESGLWEKELSGVHKFDISPDSAAPVYLGSGAVKGRLLNQFSMGEYEDHLRVATTTGMNRWDEENTLDNHIFVLKEKGGKLTVTGSLSGIGKEEEIYAVRFMGHRGFVVTYLQTDPLFTLDLSDPENPKAIGEWKGPGYSTYLHPFGDDLIIAMGVDENWRTGVSLYDLSDYEKPALVERQPLVGQDYQTAALYEHKAFTFNAATGELFLPFYDWDVSTGVLRYQIKEDGISLLGTMQMNGSLSVEGPARRAMYNNDVLIGVGACRITTAELDTPSQIISSIEIYEDACVIPGWYY